MSRNLADLKEVETSPDGRYVRFDEKLGNGAYKEVYLCYDTETGKEVAWNTVEMKRLPIAEKKRIRLETEILRELSHPHIINFYQVWENKEKEQICFTTEIVTSGTLKQYTNRVKGIKLKVIKKWCRQILTVLDYLHSHEPPIIHRDLKADNIFINGSTGEIRVGDFGLSAHRTCTHAASVLGTPEFMAPELYEENYSESVDIYAFGMCVVEMVSKEFPYEECNNAAQIWKKVSSGQKPDVLNRIGDSAVKSFVELCLCKSELRLSASELLAHPFLNFRKSDFEKEENKIVYVEPRPKEEEDEPPAEKHKAGSGNHNNINNNNNHRQQDMLPTPSPSPSNYRLSKGALKPTNNNNNPMSNTSANSHHGGSLSKPYPYPYPPSTSAPAPRMSASIPSSDSFMQFPSNTANVSGVIVDVESWSGPHASISLHIHLDNGKRKKHIRFEMDFRHDTSVSLAGEMVNDLKLPDPERTQMLIASAMEAKIEPVRKTYFTQMAGEAHEATNNNHQQNNNHNHNNNNNIPQHHSAVSPITMNSPPNPFRQMSVDKIAARPSMNTSNSLPPLPSGSVSPPGPGSRTIQRVPTAPTDMGQQQTHSVPSHTPNSLSQPSLISPTNALPPPARAHITNRSSLPPTLSPPTATVSQHRYSSSLPKDGPSLFEMAAERQQQQQLPHHPPADMPLLDAVHISPGAALNPLQCDSPTPEEEEDPDPALVSEFKNLSVGVLKERIRCKPDGDEHLKACFEKPDLIQMLVRLTLQERKHSNASNGGPTPTSGNASNGNTPQIPTITYKQSSISEPLDLLSNPVTPNIMSTSTINPHISNHSTPHLSPDPFAHLDTLTPSISPDIPAHPHSRNSHQGSGDKTNIAANISPTHIHIQPTHSHHAHHSFDVTSPLTNPLVAAFPFSPEGPFSNHSESAPAPVTASPRNKSTIPPSFDFHVTAVSPSARPIQGNEIEIDAGLQLFSNDTVQPQDLMTDQDNGFSQAPNSFQRGHLLAGVTEEEDNSAADEGTNRSTDAFFPSESSHIPSSHSLDMSIDVFSPPLDNYPTRPPLSAGQKKHSHSTSIPTVNPRRTTAPTYRKNTTAADSDLHEFFQRGKHEEFVDSTSSLHLIPGLAAVQNHHNRQKSNSSMQIMDLLGSVSSSPPAVSHPALSSTKSEPAPSLQVSLDPFQQLMDRPAASIRAMSPAGPPTTISPVDPFADISLSPSPPTSSVSLSPPSLPVVDTTSTHDPFDPLSLPNNIASMRHKHTPSLDQVFPRGQK